MSFDDKKATVEDYKNWGYDAFSEMNNGVFNNVSFAMKKDSAIALCLYKGNAKSKCLSPTGAREMAKELKEIYLRGYGKSFPVSTDGLALELMYHAYPPLIMDIFDASTNPIIRQIPELIQKIKNVKQSCYWADSGVNDKLRCIDKYASTLLDIIDITL